MNKTEKIQRILELTGAPKERAKDIEELTLDVIDPVLSKLENNNEDSKKSNQEAIDDAVTAVIKDEQEKHDELVEAIIDSDAKQSELLKKELVLRRKATQEIASLKLELKKVQEQITKLLK